MVNSVPNRYDRARGRATHGAVLLYYLYYGDAARMRARAQMETPSPRRR